MPFLFKVVVSALIIAAVSELAKRFTVLGASLASLPLTSILPLTCWYLYARDTKPGHGLDALLLRHSGIEL